MHIIYLFDIVPFVIIIIIPLYSARFNIDCIIIYFPLLYMPQGNKDKKYFVCYVCVDQKINQLTICFLPAW